MAKGSTVEVPTREVPAPGGGEVSRPPMERWPGTGAHEERPGARGEAPDGPVRGYGPEDFPGCESFPLPERALEHYEGRLEFWDGRTETAWKVSEPTSFYHEGPSMALAQMGERVASLRGSPLKCFGSVDLVRRDAAGRRRWLMQADQVLFLHPERVRWRRALDVDTDPLPDVVLEVDHSTDVRKRKLGIYQESGFPEIWVLVPWESSRRVPGLVVHVRRGERYREEAESRAFPGWRVEEIFGALTEAPWSAETVRAVERVALAMGAREGTRPEDDAFTRSISRRADARGYARGQGEALAASVRAVLAGRDIEAALDSPEDRALLAALPAEVPDRGGVRVQRRGRLPAPGARAARATHRTRPLTRFGPRRNSPRPQVALAPWPSARTASGASATPESAVRPPFARRGLEVDYGTDVRRRKLGIYQASEFAEVHRLFSNRGSAAPGLSPGKIGRSVNRACRRGAPRAPLPALRRRGERRLPRDVRRPPRGVRWPSPRS